MTLIRIQAQRMSRQPLASEGKVLHRMISVRSRPSTKKDDRRVGDERGAPEYSRSIDVRPESLLELNEER